jgi:hypothetical protein
MNQYRSISESHLLTLGTAQVHAALDTDRLLTHLNQRRGQIGILASRAPAAVSPVAGNAEYSGVHDLPGDVDELWPEVPHTLDTVIEVLQTLPAD